MMTSVGDPVVMGVPIARPDKVLWPDAARPRRSARVCAFRIDAVTRHHPCATLHDPNRTQRRRQEIRKTTATPNGH